MSDTTNTNSFADVFELMEDMWAWKDTDEVYLYKNNNWEYQFHFECDDPEAIVLLKAYIRSKCYGQTND